MKLKILEASRSFWVVCSVLRALWMAQGIPMDILKSLSTILQIAIFKRIVTVLYFPFSCSYFHKNIILAILSMWIKRGQNWSQSVNNYLSSSVFWKEWQYPDLEMKVDLQVREYIAEFMEYYSLNLIGIVSRPRWRTSHLFLQNIKGSSYLGNDFFEVLFLHTKST